MKKVIAFLSIVGVMTFMGLSYVHAGGVVDTTKSTGTAEQTKVDASSEEALAPTMGQENSDELAPEQTFNQVLKQKYIEGGALWMSPILICLIFGLALVVERVLYLNLATTSVKKLLAAIEEKVAKGDYEGAKDICRNTRGPVASIFYQGLARIDQGLDDVEKAIISYGGVQTGRLESNLTWIALFIALAPMLGFFGTVIGMVQAFDNIQKQGDISPTVVAGGMKVALITTVFGLFVAMLLQLCYNYILYKIETLVNTMEDSSITFMDILIKRNK